jgi:hypothetical protein
MSKNNKQANKAALAKQFKMKKGPSSTAKKNEKVRCWWKESSPTFWRKPKDLKKAGAGESEKAALTFFRALAEEKAKAEKIKKMRTD